jgi:hypothetical protein
MVAGVLVPCLHIHYRYHGGCYRLLLVVKVVKYVAKENRSQNHLRRRGTLYSTVVPGNQFCEY